MDTIDKSILELLRENARTPISGLAEKTGLSRAAVRSRIAALEDSGVIRGYHARVEQGRSFGSGVSVLLIQTSPQTFEQVAERLLRESCIISLCQLSGGNTLCAVCTSEKGECAAENLAWKYRTYQNGVERITVSAISEVFKGGLLPISFEGGADLV